MLYIILLLVDLLIDKLIDVLARRTLSDAVF